MQLRLEPIAYLTNRNTSDGAAAWHWQVHLHFDNIEAKDPGLMLQLHGLHMNINCVMS